MGECLGFQAEGLRLAPNLSATKVCHLLDLHDVDRDRDLCFGTVDSWIVWKLTDGAVHVTDLSNAAVTGLINRDGSDWDSKVLSLLRIPEGYMPDDRGLVGHDRRGDRARRRASDHGYRRRSAGLADRPGLCRARTGQDHVRHGRACSTSSSDPSDPSFDTRGSGGTFPIVAWRRNGEVTWGLEAIMLSAGTNVEWLRDDLGIISTTAESHDIASQCDDTDGVMYVPALLGLGTPFWDYGARGTLLGLTRGAGRPQIVRAVLEGVAHRGADLVDAAEHDGTRQIAALRIDGGMSRNPTFVQALADASGRPVEISPVVEATTLGAAFFAGLAVGTWGDWDDIAATWKPTQVVEPGTGARSGPLADAVERSRRWFGDLSSLDF